MPHSVLMRPIAIALGVILALGPVAPCSAAKSSATKPAAAKSSAAKSSVAKPTNAAIEAKRLEAEAANTKLDELNTDLEMRQEELGQIEDAVTKTRDQISVAESDLASATADVQYSEALLSRRAVNIYRNGPVDIIAVFVGATDFQDFISRLDLMRRIGRSDASLVAAVKDARERVLTAKQSLETRQTEQLALRAQARRKSAQVEQALAAQTQFLAGLNAELKQLIEVERVKQEQIAAAKAAAEAAARAAAAAQLANAKMLPFDESKLGAPHPEAVEIAKRYLGVPYVWGGSTPAGFDCSGLMQYVYAQLGIAIPRNSRAQFHAGAYIPPNRLDLLQPGDMVFFGYNGDPDLIHHVGMYVGADQFLHAPATGDIVRITSLSGRIATRGDYVGAARP